MTAPALHFADAREAADLAAFLARLIHYDRAAAVRVQATGVGAGPRAGGVLAVFGRPASFEVLAIRTATLAPGPAVPSTASGPVASGPARSEVGASAGAAEAVADGASGEWDRTVSAGQFADAIDEARQRARAGAGRADGPAGLTVYAPEPVTGPPWAGVLPPRGGWQRVPGLPDSAAVRAMVAAAVAEFRARDEALAPEQRTRTERDRIGREIWSRTVGDTQLPLRALHAAQAVGFLRFARPRVGEAGRPHPSVLAPAGAAAAAHGSNSDPGAGIGADTGPASGTGTGIGSGTGADAGSGSGGSSVAAGAVDSALVLFAARGWLRLRTPYGSIAVRTGGLSGLSVTPA